MKNNTRRWPLIALMLLPVLWHADTVFTDARYFLVDIMEQYFPWWQFAREHLLHGELPLWNPYALGGVPFHLNPQAGLFYPPHLPLFFLLDFPDAMVVLRVFHVFVASLGMYVLVRDLSAARVSSFLGAVMFGYGSFMSYEIVYPTYINTMAWFPWELLLLRRLVRSPTARHTVLLAMVVAISFLGGMPQAFFVTHLALGFFLLFILIEAAGARQWKQIGLACAHLLPAVLLAIGLSAALLLPVARYLTSTARATPGFYHHNIVEYSSIQPAIKALFYPHYHLLLGAPYPPVQHIYLVELPYVGMFGVLLLLAHFTSARFRWVMPTTLTIFCFAVLMSRGAYSPFFAGLYRTLAPFRWFRWPYDYLHMIYPALALGAATGFDILWRDPDRHMRRFAVVAVLYLAAGSLWLRDALTPALLAVAILALVLLRPRLPRFTSTRKCARHLIAAVAMLILCVDLFWYGFYYRRYVPRDTYRLSHYEPIAAYLQEHAPLARSSVAAFDMMYMLGKERVFFDYLQILPDESTPPRTWRSARDWLRCIHARDAAAELWARETANQYPHVHESAWDNCFGFPSHAGVLFTHEDTGGYDTFMMQRMQDLYQSVPIERTWSLMNVEYVVTPNKVLHSRLTPVFTNDTAVIYRNTSVFPRAMLPDRVRWAMAPDRILDTLRMDNFDPRKTVLLEVPAPRIPPPENHGSVDTTTNCVTFVSKTENSVVLDVTRALPGPLVLHDAYYPNWEVTVDGRKTELYRANYAFRACFVPAGSHRVEFRYRPALFYRSLGISAVCWTLGLCWLAVSCLCATRPDR